MSHELSKKKKLFYTVLLVLSFVSAMEAATFNAANGDWSVAGNWDPVGLPGAADIAAIDSSRVCNFNTTSSVEQLQLGLDSNGTLNILGGLLTTGTADRSCHIGGGAGTGTLTMTGGSIVANNRIAVGGSWSGTGNAVVDLSGDASITVAPGAAIPDLMFAYDLSQSVTLNISGTASISAPRWFEFRYGNANITQTGGSVEAGLTASGALRIGWGGLGTSTVWTMSDGTIEANILIVGNSSFGLGILNLYGGVVTTNSLSVSTDNASRIDIVGEGILNVRDLGVSEVQTLIDSGKITGYGLVVQSVDIGGTTYTQVSGDGGLWSIFKVSAGDWSVAGNWFPVGLPGSSVTAMIKDDRVCNFNTAASVDQLQLGMNTDGTLNVDGGALDADMFIIGSGDGEGILNLNGGVVTTNGLSLNATNSSKINILELGGCVLNVRDLSVSEVQALIDNGKITGTGLLVQSVDIDGTLYSQVSGDDALWSVFNAGTGDWSVAENWNPVGLPGPSVAVAIIGNRVCDFNTLASVGQLVLGLSTDGTLNVDGGTLNADELDVGRYDGVGILNLCGGAVTTNDLFINPLNLSAIDISGEGALNVRDLNVSQVQALIDSGKITGTGLFVQSVEIEGTAYTQVIIELRPFVEFDTSTSGSLEEVTPATISISLSKVSTDTVTVDYVVSGGTATSGVDYNLSDGTLVFDPGQMTQSVSIDVVDDLSEEDFETIELTLSNPTHARLGDKTQHIFAICDKTYSLLKGAFYYRLDSGEDWEDVARVDDYADVKVRLGEQDDKFVFWRGSSYRPYWQTDFGTWYVTEAVQMQGGADGLRPDEINQYSQVFIIENSPARTVVRWRYAHDMYADVDFKWGDFVDEYYTLYPDGICVRTIRTGSDNLQEWLDPNNVIIEILHLLQGGISSVPSSWLNQAGLLLSGSSYNNYDNEGFDDMQRCYVLKCRKNGTPSTLDFTLDTTGGKSTHNPAIVVKNWGDAGVSITLDGQAFTNYYTGYNHHLEGSDLVVWFSMKSESSTDISILPIGGTIPTNRSPQVNAGPYQSIEVTPGTGPYEVELAGSVDDDGLPNDSLTTTWSKLSGPGSADFDNPNSPVTSVSLSMEGTYQLRLGAYDGELFGEDDVTIIVDENPDEENERVPIFPAGPAEPGRFGAYYAQLKYSPEWDELWRVGDHVDVVVQFDEFFHRFVFWRGTSYIPCWVTDPIGGGWYTNEFLERRGSQGGCEGCAEPMSDKQCRHGHVRIIESNDARVIVHWRYPPVDVYYCHPYLDETGWGDWVDEYYTIYPDAVGVRKAKLYTLAPDDWTEWQEAIVLNQPGTMPENNLNLEAVSLANMDGESHTYSWEIAPPARDAFTEPPNANIQTINLKGPTRPFQVVDHDSTSITCYTGHAPDSHFNWWNHWPVAQEKSDTTLATSANRPSHTSLSHLRWVHYAEENGIVTSRTKIMLNGMTNKTVAELVPLARSWEMPPVLSINSSGFTGGSYDKTERAYKIVRNSEEATAIEFTLQGSSESPIVNPCFVIENWYGDDSNVRLSIDGQRITPGPDFRRGVEKDANEVASLVIWIKKESTSPINITIAQKIPGDFDENGTVNLYDLSSFFDHWLCSYEIRQGYDLYDIDQNGEVDFVDFAVLSSHWYESNP